MDTDISTEISRQLALLKAQLQAEMEGKIAVEVERRFARDKMSKVRLIAGTSNPLLAQGIADSLGMDLTDAKLDKFGNGELQVQVRENIRGRHCVIIQTSVDRKVPFETKDGQVVFKDFSLNDHLMQTCILIRACKLADAKSISVVYPFYPYARSDKKDDGRVAIGSSLCTDMMTKAGATSFIAVDLHAGQIQGFTDCPFDNLYGMNTLIGYLRETYFKDLTLQQFRELYEIVSPDQGGAKRARAWGQKLLIRTAVMDKHRDYSQQSTVDASDLIGTVEGMECFIVDDMMDTGGTMMAACKELISRGAKEVHVIVTHGVMSGPAIDRINETDAVKSVIVTNSIPQERNLKRCPKLKVVDVAPLIAAAIRCHRTGESISKLFA